MASLSGPMLKLKQRAATQTLDVVVRTPALRERLLERGERRLRRFFLEQNEEELPREVQRMRCQGIINLLRSYARAAADGRIAPRVRRKIISTFINQVVSGELDRQRPFLERHGFLPPTFLVISPTKKCNLSCKGCYAASGRRHENTLPHEDLQWILDEKRRDWGSHFNVISGGEPLLYRSQGKDLIDVFRDNPDDYFMFYTNGTLIDRSVAEQLAECGNVTPAISVEGWQKQTDARRGRGVYRRIQEAMDYLRGAGVPFGVSITATRENAETVLSQDFIDHNLRAKGAVYGWVFQYMPIGRSYTLDLMVTPEQRRWMLERQLDLIYRDELFVVDFWNGGPMSIGCMAAGRGGGYFYVDWDGKIAPCVFFPYHLDSVRDMRGEGRDLTSVLLSDYFTTIRSWQDAYAGRRNGSGPRNFYTPCPYRDHHGAAHRIVQRFGARGLDAEAEQALADPEYHRRLQTYGEDVAELLDPIWQQRLAAAERGEPAAGAARRAAARLDAGAGAGGARPT